MSARVTANIVFSESLISTTPATTNNVQKVRSVAEPFKRLQIVKRLLCFFFEVFPPCTNSVPTSAHQLAIHHPSKQYSFSSCHQNLKSTFLRYSMSGNESPVAQKFRLISKSVVISLVPSLDYKV